MIEYFSNRLTLFCCQLLMLLLVSCTSSRQSFSPAKKYSPVQLQKDYSIFRGALEESHPGLYWYTPKQEMDQYFAWGGNQLRDSMTMEEFRKVLSYVAARINCGHTAVRSSKAYARYRDTNAVNIFPLSIKVWPGENPFQDDTAVVAANLIRKDTVLKRGVVVKKINNLPLPVIIDTLCRYISSDGYNLTYKYQSLSNRGGFGFAYSSVFGNRENYFIDYVDNSGNEKSVLLPAYNPKNEPQNRNVIARPIQQTPVERKEDFRSLSRNFRVDSVNKIGFMELASFGRNLRLRSFFRTSFRRMRKEKLTHLVMDVRNNGGGSVTNSTQLTKYLADKKFKVADSLFANSRKSRYKKYISNYPVNHWFMVFMTRKKDDGKYHFGYFERHWFSPKKKNCFNGRVYILTGGNSFSATTLFTQAVKEQENVTVVGEETGGAAYGNSAWLIPDVTLPQTGIRFRLPLFRLVMSKNIPKDGKGIQPEVEAKPTIEAIRKGADYKMLRVMELIRNNQ
jgi:hypothetical protein